MADSFDIFWEAYPRKVGKKLAAQKYAKAVRQHGAATIMAGLERYKRCKPDYADWLHPSTFLHQERFKDEAEGKTYGLLPATTERKTTPMSIAIRALEELNRWGTISDNERRAINEWKDTEQIQRRAKLLGLTLP